MVLRDASASKNIIEQQDKENRRRLFCSALCHKKWKWKLLLLEIVISLPESPVLLVTKIFKFSLALLVGSMKVDEMEKNEVEIKNMIVGIPKPTFSFNLVTMVEQTKCPPLRKETKKAVHFPITSASKRKLSMEEIDMVDLKKLKNDVQGKEMEQLNSLLANMAPINQ